VLARGESGLEAPPLTTSLFYRCQERCPYHLSHMPLCTLGWTSFNAHKLCARRRLGLTPPRLRFLALDLSGAPPVPFLRKRSSRDPMATMAGRFNQPGRPMGHPAGPLGMVLMGVGLVALVRPLWDCRCPWIMVAK
jgi:hypothetical protein